MKTARKRITAAAATFTAAFIISAPLTAAAEQKVVTEYDELWTGDIEVKAGKSVKWYVNVPEGTEPKGCKATIKIPGLGWGTDSHNKEEGHLKLAEGENFVYEFTPEKAGDILFTCWMGSSCHANYIHVTEPDTPTNVENPTADETGETAETPPQENTDPLPDSEQEQPSQEQPSQESADNIESEDETTTEETDDESPTSDEQEEEKPNETVSNTPAGGTDNSTVISTGSGSNPNTGTGFTGKALAAALTAGAAAVITGKKRGRKK